MPEVCKREGVITGQVSVSFRWNSVVQAPELEQETPKRQKKGDRDEERGN